MEAYIVKGTDFSPDVTLDSQALKFEISGEARPENTGKFFDPIIKWLEDYEAVLFWQKNKFGKESKLIFEFKFEYFNSTSAKYIMDIINLMDKYHTNGHDVLIRWHYDAQDTDMQESGEEFAKLVKVQFEFMPD